MMNFVELSFPVLGESLPTDHGYALYGALATLLPALHDNTLPFSIGHISGAAGERALLQIDRRSRLRFRLPADLIGDLLPLAAKKLNVAGSGLRVGIPQVRPITPATSLIARLVTIKSATTAESFLEAFRIRLREVGIEGEASLPSSTSRPTEPQRRVVRIKSKLLVGYAVLVEGLTAESSMTLQANWHEGRAIFSRRKLGCGYFVPLRPRAS